MGQDPRRASIEAYWTDNLALDSEYDYDPFWARCVELCIAPTAHSHAQGHGLRRSYSNYLYNQIGHFADAGEAFAKALFFGGVTRRFPDLNVGILEGGVGWACSLYAGLVSAWRKRGGEAIHSFNPSKIDYDRLAAFFESHGGEAFAETAPGDGDGESARLGYVNTATDGLTSANDLHWLDDYAAAGIERAEDIVERFIDPFYFGCEADDPMTAVAFRGKGLPFDARLKATFGGITGDGLKRAPKGFDADHPLIEDLKRQSFLAMRQADPKLAYSERFVTEVADAFKAAGPLMKFLNQANGAPF